MTHTERRLDHTLADWIAEQFHAAPSSATDAEILANIRLKMDAKVSAIFKAKYPPIMGPS